MDGVVDSLYCNVYNDGRIGVDMFRRLMMVMVGVLCFAVHARAEEIRVAAAISMKETMEAMGAAFQKETGNTVQFSFGSSGALVAQIKSGAETDLFLSAANRQMDDLEKAKLVDVDTRRVVAMNELVIVVPADSKIAPADFTALAGKEYSRIALGEPKTVPAGEYAVEVLKHLKIFDGVAERLVYGANVRQVLVYVERGEVEAGIVYRTDAKEAGDKVKMTATANAGDHEAIEYPAALIAASTHKKTARAFLDFLAGVEGRKILMERGFGVPVNVGQGDKGAR